MNPLDEVSCPVLSCAAARELETRIFAGDEAAERHAMQAAGRGIARAVLDDFLELGGFPSNGSILVLVGKGHNGGDAMIAARHILEHHPAATADVVFAFGSRALRPLASEAWRDLLRLANERVRIRDGAALAQADFGTGVRTHDLCLDGVFGFQFRPPADARIRGLLTSVNEHPIRLRAAVDLPSAGVFQADFTYATGAVKEPALADEHAGRIRYLDLGFFRSSNPKGLHRPAKLENSPGNPSARSAAGSHAAAPMDRVLTRAALEPLRRLRAARSDKRSYGHVFVVGGSRGYPGAVLMCVTAAIRSGAGLVTAFVPESLAPGFAAHVPEAIWVGWPETPDGGLALEGEHLLRERAGRADALVVGPGAGREPETLALLQSIVAASAAPIVLDADALQGDIVRAGLAARVVTPHAGEFKRIAGDTPLRDFAADPRLTVVLKGPVTRICDGGPVFCSLSGGPVLARGGSGDLLAGLIGTQLAQSPADPTGAAARAVVWQGHAADLLARAHGQVAVATTQLLDFLGPVLREDLSA